MFFLLQIADSLSGKMKYCFIKQKTKTLYTLKLYL